MLKTKFAWPLLLVVTLLAIGNGALAAGDAPGQKRVYVSREEMLDVAKELHPPGCTDSMTADYCTLPTAYDLRQEITEMLYQGKNKQQIIDELVQKYGDRILAAPPAKGFNWVVWILPGLGIAAGGGALGFLLRRWARRPAFSMTPGVAEQAVSPEQQERVQDELKKWL